MYIVALKDETIIEVDAVYCDIGHYVTGKFYDENGIETEKSGRVIHILDEFEAWQ